MHYHLLADNLVRSISLISWMKEASRSGDDTTAVLSAGLIVLEQILIQHLEDTKKRLTPLDGIPRTS